MKGASAFPRCLSPVLSPGALSPVQRVESEGRPCILAFSHVSSGSPVLFGFAFLFVGRAVFRAISDTPFMLFRGEDNALPGADDEGERGRGGEDEGHGNDEGHGRRRGPWTTTRARSAQRGPSGDRTGEGAKSGESLRIVPQGSTPCCQRCRRRRGVKRASCALSRCFTAVERARKSSYWPDDLASTHGG